ncbi:MAG: YeiH family protein, partial [Cyanobacteria bacterium P01_A01_bin.137]
SPGNPIRFSLGPARWLNTLHGIFFVSLFSLAAYHVSSFDSMKSLRISPVIVGLILGAIYANSFGKDLPSEWMPGIGFCKDKILNVAIIFYGVKLTFQDLFQVGLGGFLASVFIVISTFIVAFLIGKYCFKLDYELSLLIAAGSSICGSAAILATSSILKSKSYKNSVAVAITFLFGTAGMLLFPLVYRLGWLPINEDIFGIFLGATLPSVGNVAAAGAAISEAVAKNAIIIKMIRVMMLVPFLLFLGSFVSKKYAGGDYDTPMGIPRKNKLVIPWFAILFMVMIAMNSWLQPPLGVVDFINHADKFCLTMAMTALGLETSANKMQGVGLKPIYLGFVVSIWLVAAGLLIVHFTG